MISLQDGPNCGRPSDMCCNCVSDASLVFADVVISTDPEEACKDVDIAVMVGGFPRKGGMERKDVMAKNVAIYKSQAAALQSGAKPDVKVKTHIVPVCATWWLSHKAPTCSGHGCSRCPYLGP